MRKVLVAALLGCLPLAASAQAPQRPAVLYTVDAPTSPIGAPLVAHPGEPLLIQPLHAARAARLDAQVEVAAGWGRRRTLTPGTLLFAAYNTPDPVFCAPALAKGRMMWGLYFPCFEDTNGDGAFDTVATAMEVVGGGPLVGVVDEGTVTDFRITGKPQPLRTPLRFAEIPYDQGPAAAVRFRWQWGHKAGEPAKVSIWTNLGATDSQYSRVIGEPTIVPLGPDGTATLNVEGAVFTVLRLDPDGTLHYRVDQAIPRTSGPVKVRPVPATIYIYI